MAALPILWWSLGRPGSQNSEGAGNSVLVSFDFGKSKFGLLLAV
jgi:hypothetical protein